MYPIGKDNDYRRVDVIIDQNIATSTTYSGEVFNSSAMALGYTLPATIDMVSGKRYYEVKQSAATGLDSVKVKIYYGTDRFFGKKTSWEKYSWRLCS